MAKSATGRMVRDRQEAGELLGHWEDSGQRMSDWCSERGINWYSLNAYRGRGVLPVHDELQFVELTVAVPPAQVAPSASVGRYVIRVGEIEVEVDDHFRGDTLVRLLVLGKPPKQWNGVLDVRTRSGTNRFFTSEWLCYLLPMGDGVAILVDPIGVDEGVEEGVLAQAVAIAVESELGELRYANQVRDLSTVRPEQSGPLPDIRCRMADLRYAWHPPDRPIRPAR